MRSKTMLANKSRSRVSRREQPRKRDRQALQIRNVLVPVDFSAPSLSAVQFALPLIAKFGAQLHLVHVFGREFPITTLVAMPLVFTELEIDRSVHWHLKDVAKKYSIALPAENLHALKGQPFEGICRLARDIKIDLIVRDRDLSSRATSFRKILVPIDFSECSMKGLAYAKAFAKEFKSRLVLLNSVHFQYYVASDEYGRYDLPRLMQSVEKTAREQMRDLVEKTDWGGLQVETSLQTGHAGQQICDGARDCAADLIVTSTHGRTGFKHVLLGSTAEYVVRHAHCPVLVVPSHERPALTSTKTQT